LRPSFSLLFPYTTLFRSGWLCNELCAIGCIWCHCCRYCFEGDGCICFLWLIPLVFPDRYHSVVGPAHSCGLCYSETAPACIATPDRKSTRLNSSHVKISY